MSRAAMSQQNRTPATPQAKTPAAAPARQQVPHEKIAQRAYEKWVGRGCTHGCDAQDWAEAEAELRAETVSPNRTATPPSRR